jgi:transglutaminase-like putative cysteine protease
VYLKTPHVGRPALLAHELRHVAQYERHRSVREYLGVYIPELLALGYDRAPLEQDAREAERHGVAAAALDLEPFLRSTGTIDWENAGVRSLAAQLAGRHTHDRDVARACFEWVRDEIAHTGDHALDPVTCAASDVLRQGTGYCYAKSHLLAALLRANGIACGLTYQRLADGGGFCLHGLNAVWLPGLGWYRIDARGRREGLNAELDPPHERLPFAIRAPGERQFSGVWAEPAAPVVNALRQYGTRAELSQHWPDATDLGAGDATIGSRRPT